MGLAVLTVVRHLTITDMRMSLKAGLDATPWTVHPRMEMVDRVRELPSTTLNVSLMAFLKDFESSPVESREPHIHAVWMGDHFVILAGHPDLETSIRNLEVMSVMGG